jgi:DNA-binding transcriptional regulator PaaX
LFVKKEYITGRNVSETLGLSARMSRVLLNRWVKDGWLVVANISNRARTYSLSAIYRQYITNLSAMAKK